MRWQADAFEGWRDLARSRGTPALEALLFVSMLIGERRAKEEGLSAGGQRPLRYWRPGSLNFLDKAVRDRGRDPDEDERDNEGL